MSSSHSIDHHRTGTLSVEEGGANVPHEPLGRLFLEPSIRQDVTADAVHRANDQRRYRRLNRCKDRGYRARR